MHVGKYVFSQLCEFLPKRAFDCLVAKYEGDKYVKSFSCWNQLLVLLIGQLSHRESLRDLVVTLSAHRSKFHHLGLGKSVSRSNLAKANEIRDVRIFQEFSERMIRLACEERADMAGLFPHGELYAFDSSTINFCLKKFWWSHAQEGYGGIKLHSLYDTIRDVPVFNLITDHSVSDSTIMDCIPYCSGAFYVFNKAYVSTPQLRKINEIRAFFIVCRKRNMVYTVLEEKSRLPAEEGIMADRTIRFTSRIAGKGYPDALRQVIYYSKELNETFDFITNNRQVPALDIALAYKYRWRIEVFFKWMKQHLKIKESYVTSENAVKIRRLRLDISTYMLLRILSLSLFEKLPLMMLFEENREENYQNDTQLNLNFFSGHVWGVDTPEEVSAKQIIGTRVRFIPEVARSVSGQVSTRSLVSENTFWEELKLDSSASSSGGGEVEEGEDGSFG